MNVHIAGLEFTPMIKAELIQQRVEQLGKQLNQQFEGKTPIMLGILNGSLLFMADLLRQFKHPCQMAFIKIASYHGGLQTTRQMRLDLDLNIDIANRHLVLVEDIVDTGHTLSYVLNLLASRQPASITVCTLLLKPSALESPLTQPTLTGFEIENKFVVGYGLDYQELGRNLPHIYQLVQ